MPFGSSACLDKLQEQLQNVILSTRVLKRDHLCRTVMGKQWSWDLLIRDRNKRHGGAKCSSILFPRHGALALGFIHCIQCVT